MDLELELAAPQVKPAVGAAAFTTKVINATVLVAALGYFVDMFDLTIYGVVRLPSLEGLGILDPKQQLEIGMWLNNLALIGMLLGGLLWGILGDKFGRLSILFGSIFLYSLGNIANSFVTTIPQYSVARFVSGVGLAGELGAAITLVSEILSKENRGWATTLIATLGLLGAVTAALVGQALDWRAAYFVGGSLGLLLLAARFKTHESQIFKSAVRKDVKRGNFWMLLKWRRLPKYVGCILIGVPVWFTTAILMTFAPELTRELQIAGPITAGNALLFGSIGLTLGDLASGVISQMLRSRKKGVALFLTGILICSGCYFKAQPMTSAEFYTLCLALGVFAGYWAVFVTIAAEQFGTNIRALVATTVPNFVRSSVVLITLVFSSLHAHTTFTLAQSAAAVGGVCVSLAFVALIFLPETYGKDLDYFEED